MDEISPAFDPFQVAIGRAQMEKVADYRAARAATDGMSWNDVMRCICRVVDLAAAKFDLPIDWKHGDLQEICRAYRQHAAQRST